MGRDGVVSTATCYAGRPGDRISVGARFSTPVHTGKDCDHPWLFYETKSGLRARRSGKRSGK